MTDFQPDAPILVHASPTKPQIEAAIRQLVVGVGPFLGLWGFSNAESLLGSLLTYVGPASAIIAFVWGQWATRVAAKKQAALAERLPDSVAAFK